MKEFGKDLTSGSIPRHLLNISIPLLVANLLSSGYSIINMIWVGNILGENAVGATAVSFPVIFILIGLASGATMATSVLISQYFGAKDYLMVEKTVDTSVSISLILGLILTVGGIFSSDYLLKLMDTPAQVYSMASGYLKIMLAGFILMYLSFLITSILRGIGDTMTPLAFIAIAVIINAILDPLLIIGIGPFPKLGLNGAAYASMIAQGVALILGLIYLNHKNHIIAVHLDRISLDQNLAWLIFKIGFPSMVQQSLVSIGAAFITTFVNYYGAQAIAAFGAASRIDQLAIMPAIAIGMATTAITGQNLGAAKPERVKEIFKWGVILAAISSAVIALLAIGIPRTILYLFVHEPEVLNIGETYLRIVGVTYVLFAIMFVSNGIINGAGQTMITMIFSLLALWVVRVPLAAVLTHTSFGITGIWIAVLISAVVVTGISLLYYRSGKWKKAIGKIHSPVMITQEVIE